MTVPDRPPLPYNGGRRPSNLPHQEIVLSTDPQTAAEVDADTVANRAAQVITSMGADIRALTGERDRYRGAWRSARERAQAYGEGILRVVKDREQYQEWLRQAEERAAAVPAAPVAAPPTGQRTCACGRTPDPGICPTDHDGYQAGGHCTCAHQPADRASIHRAAEEQIRAAARNLFFDTGARVLAAFDVVSPTGQAGLRDRIEDVLVTTRRTDYEGVADHRQHRYDARCALCAGDVDALTDAVLSVLPVDRGAVLREAADLIEARQDRLDAEERAKFDWLDHETVLQGAAIRDMAAYLREQADDPSRLAAETPGPETQSAAVLLSSRCDACRHTLNWHRNDVGCTVALCVCSRFQPPAEEPAVVAEPGKENDRG